MKRYGVVAVLLCFLCIAALQPAAGQLLTISNLERYYDDGGGYEWHSQLFTEAGMCKGGAYFSQDGSEAYIDGDVVSNPNVGTVGDIYPPFPLTPGFGDYNTWPVRFSWKIDSPDTPVYLVVYSGIDYPDIDTGDMYTQEWLLWNSGPICSESPVAGAFQTDQGTPQYFRIELTTTPVPEPTGILVILAGIGALKLRRRK